MTYTDFYTAYRNAQPSTQELIDSEKIGNFVDQKLVSDHNLNQEHKKKLIVLISNTLVGINSINELPTLLPYILGSKADAETVRKEILEFLNSNSTTSASQAASKIDLSSDIKELEQEVHELQSLRTFASDMKAHTPLEPNHQSSQDTLLNKSGSTSGTPRWGSDS